jgi:hypothetical protein
VLQVLLRRPSVFSHVQKLSLIDLAGSERSLATELRSARSAEGASINKSLLVLGRCIAALVAHLPHAPFFESKLTTLLRPSLGGNARTTVVACCRQADAHGDETIRKRDRNRDRDREKETETETKTEARRDRET